MEGTNFLKWGLMIKIREWDLHNKFYLRIFLSLMESLKEFYNFLKYFNEIN